jgi:DNA polymerase III delta prime subunit
MSQLDQAKREAKRLFNLAKSHPEENIFKLPFTNLSSAKEYVAFMNGYDKWHDYEEHLKRKDFVYDIKDKNSINKENKAIIENKEYFIQDIEFVIHSNVKPEKQNILCHTKEHQSILLGNQFNKKQQNFFNKEKDKKWILNNYPVLISGSTGAGKTETLLGLASQYLENKEGCIYIDGKAEHSLYYKIFSYCEEFNRLNDLYCLNFMSKNDMAFKDDIRRKTHTIDLINPMIGNEDYFKKFFGDPIGILIHSLAVVCKSNNWLIDLQCLESMLMLPNLVNWRKNKFFGEVEYLNEYLNNLGLLNGDNSDEEELESAINNHAYNCKQATSLMETLKLYSDMFSIYPDINIKNMFLYRKVLVVFLPALEKHQEVVTLLGSLVTEQLAHVDRELNNLGIHFQNIIVDEFPYYIKNGTKHWQPLLNSSCNNWIFALQDFGYRNQEFIQEVINYAKTTVMMKSEPGREDFPNKLKIEMVDNMEKIPSILYFNDIKHQREGEAYVFSKNRITCKDNNVLNNDVKYYVERLKCIYRPPTKKSDYIYLVEHS